MLLNKFKKPTTCHGYFTVPEINTKNALWAICFNHRAFLLSVYIGRIWQLRVTSYPKLPNNVNYLRSSVSDLDRFVYTHQDNEDKLQVKKLKCGRRYRKARMLKIIGGRESKRYKWPWHVAVMNKFMVKCFKVH